MKYGLAKKLCALFILLNFTTFCFAQIRPGIRAGLNVSNVNQLTNSEKVDSRPNIRFHAGATVDFPVSEKFFIQPALLFSVKGASTEEKADNITLRFTQTPYYVEMPVNAVFVIPVGGAKLQLGGGPYFAYAVGGTYTLKLKEGSNAFTKTGTLRFTNNMSQQEVDKLQNVESFEDLPSTITYSKPLDMGIEFLAGFKFKEKIVIQYNAQIGIPNLMPSVAGQKFSNISMRNTLVSISAGYLF